MCNEIERLLHIWEETRVVQSIFQTIPSRQVCVQDVHQAKIALVVPGNRINNASLQFSGLVCFSLSKCGAHMKLLFQYLTDFQILNLLKASHAPNTLPHTWELCAGQQKSSVRFKK